MFSFVLWVVDLVLWLSCHKTTKKKIHDSPTKKQLRNDPWFMSHRVSNAIVFRRFRTWCYLISFEWRNTVLNSPCWLLLLSSEFKLELIYAQETLSRSPLTSIESMNSQNQQKQSITQNSSSKNCGTRNSMLFRHRIFNLRTNTQCLLKIASPQQEAKIVGSAKASLAKASKSAPRLVLQAIAFTKISNRKKWVWIMKK